MTLLWKEELIGISGLVVEYIVAIDVTRVRFPADAVVARGCFVVGNLPCEGCTANDFQGQRDRVVSAFDLCYAYGIPRVSLFKP